MPPPPTAELRPLAEDLLSLLQVEHDLLTQARQGVMGLYAALRNGDVAAVQQAQPRNEALADRLTAHADARATAAARLAIVLDLPPDASLQAVAARSPEPFASRLLVARTTLRTLATQVDQFRSANANLIDRLRGFFHDVLAGLTTPDTPTRYGPSGAWLSTQPASATVVASG